jgi:hypothetical protein
MKGQKMEAPRLTKYIWPSFRLDGLCQRKTSRGIVPGHLIDQTTESGANAVGVSETAPSDVAVGRYPISPDGSHTVSGIIWVALGEETADFLGPRA